VCSASPGKSGRTSHRGRAPVLFRPLDRGSGIVASSSRTCGMDIAPGATSPCGVKFQRCVGPPCTKASDSGRPSSFVGRRPRSGVMHIYPAPRAGKEKMRTSHYGRRHETPGRLDGCCTCILGFLGPSPAHLGTSTRCLRPYLTPPGRLGKAPASEIIGLVPRPHFRLGAGRSSIAGEKRRTISMDTRAGGASDMLRSTPPDPSCQMARTNARGRVMVAAELEIFEYLPADTGRTQARFSRQYSRDGL